MPHIQIEYSRNLEELVDMSKLCETLRAQAVLIDAFPLPGVRVRAIGADHYAIADGDPKHSFIDISVRIREGRTAEVKRDAMQQLFDAARSFLSPVLSRHSIALSAELREINADLSPKYGTIRDHLEDNT